MYSSYQDHEQLEDDLYREEDDSEGSEADSELEFYLYSQLHYSSNAGEVTELEVERKEMDEISTQGDHNLTDSDKLVQLSENGCTAELQKDKEKKRTKHAKNNKPKVQRASTVFEEVVVIDSSPDVITLSEDESIDEGVCVLKGGRLPTLCTSTPAQQVKMRAAVPINVSSSESPFSSSPESESESESQSVLSSSNSSGSDDLENWMILGCGQQEEDLSISLNLEGVPETDIEVLDSSWIISDKDREAQISNKTKGVKTIVPRVVSRYYTEKNVHCKNCKRTGHLSTNCPEPKRASPCFLCGTLGHNQSACPYKHCYYCGLPGHQYSSCQVRSSWHKNCHRCSMIGHSHDDCPEVWRQYHITIKRGPPVIHQGNKRGRTPAYCYNCGKKGHFGHVCHGKRMFNWSYPSTPVINRYDTIIDLKTRQKRVEKKVKDLQNIGVIPYVPQLPSSPGPPRKKQKTTFEKNNHHHKKRQSFKTDLPASSHIFFSDTPDSISKSSKQKRHKPVSLGKQWKPKRPVPQSRDSVPKIVLDEADDFPRGGGQGEEMERRKKNKKLKKNGLLFAGLAQANKQDKDNNANPIKKKKRKNAKKNYRQFVPN